MATNKTSFLGLNDFVGTDPFRREEINVNFRSLDAKMKEHDDSIGSLSKDANEYEWTSAAGQLTYVLPAGQSYNTTSKWFEVTVGGAPVPLSQIQMDSPSQFTLLVDAASIPDGVTVVARWVEPFVPATAGHHTKHELGGADEIDITKLKNYNEQVATPLADNAKVNINQFPRLTGETHDIPRINRAIAYLSGLGRKAELLFNGETYTVIPQKPAAGDTTANADTKRIRLRDNVSLIGIKGKTIIQVSANNPNYHCLVEEEKPSVQPIQNVTIKGITFDHNVFNNTDKPDGAINNHKECFRIYQSKNLIIEDCKILCNSINTLNFRMGINQTNANNGIYPNVNLNVKNNEFVFVALDLPYFDNTFVTLNGDGINVENNKITTDRTSLTGSSVGGDNTAIEVSGVNIDCVNNRIESFMLGIDVMTLDAYSSKRNIKVMANKIHDCARGVKLWGGYSTSYYLSGIIIQKNDIKLNQTLYTSRQENSTRCGIGLGNHTTGSIGNFQNIDIWDNRIRMDNSPRDYLLTLTYPGSYYLSLEFDAHYNGLYFGGSSALVDTVSIEGNEFRNLPCPSVYFAHANIKNVTINSNVTIDGGYGKRSPILTFKKSHENFTVDRNTFVDNGSLSMNGSILYLFGSSADSASFKNFTLGRNLEAVRVGSYTTTKGDLYQNVKQDKVSAFLDSYSDTVKNGLLLTNSVVNGNFASGTGSWSVSGGTISASNNILTVTGNGTALYARALQNTSVAASTGKKIYIRFKAMVTNSICQKINITYAGTTGGSGSVDVQLTPATNQWYDLSTVITVPASVTGNINLYLAAYYADAATANTQVMQIQNVVMIDLTTIYGTGNEPISSRITSVLDDYFNSWFDTTKGIGGLPKSGTTANRPSGVFAGFPYFDTTLNKPIWRNASNTGWVDSAGTTV